MEHDLGMIMGCFWNDYGMILEWLWDVFGIIVECFCKLPRLPFSYTQISPKPR